MNEERDTQSGARPGEPGSTDAEFEALLERALRIPVPAQGAAEVAAPRARRRPVRYLALAASVLVAAGVWLGVRQDTVPGGPQLTADVLEHVTHDGPYQGGSAVPRIRQAVTVEAARFDGVLERAGARRNGDIGQVTYVQLCPFRGHQVAHFAIEGAAGPVTVMLLPDEQVSEPMMFMEDGFEGTIVPLRIGGSMAVIGQPGEDLELIQERLIDAIQWKL